MKMNMFLKLLIYQMIRDKFINLRKSIFLNAIKSPLFDKKKFQKISLIHLKK